MFRSECIKDFAFRLTSNQEDMDKRYSIYAVQPNKCKSVCVPTFIYCNEQYLDLIMFGHRWGKRTSLNFLNYQLYFFVTEVMVIKLLQCILVFASSKYFQLKIYNILVWSQGFETRCVWNLLASCLVIWINEFWKQ